LWCNKKGHYQFECPNLDKETNFVEFDKEEEILLMAHAEVQRVRKTGYSSLILIV